MLNLHIDGNTNVKCEQALTRYKLQLTIVVMTHICGSSLLLQARI